MELVGPLEDGGGTRILSMTITRPPDWSGMSRQGEELIVNRRPNHVAGPFLILPARRARKAAQGAVGEPIIFDVLRLDAVVPEDPHRRRIIQRADGGGRADDHVAVGTRTAGWKCSPATGAP